MLKRLAVMCVVVMGMAAPAWAQLGSLPYPAVSGAVISSSEMNANFAIPFANSLNRTGGSMTGTLTTLDVVATTTATSDIGTSAVKYRDFYFSRNGVIGGTLGVTGVATFTAQPILSSLTASVAVFSDASKGLVSNAITGTGNVVMSASPTLSGTIAGTYTLGGTPTIPASGLTGTVACAQMPALTGNVTTSAGACATTIGSAVVTNAMLAGSIAYSKLVLTGAILNADLAGSIAASKLVGSDIATVGTITSGIWSAGSVTSSGRINMSATQTNGSATGDIIALGGQGFRITHPTLATNATYSVAKLTGVSGMVFGDLSWDTHFTGNQVFLDAPAQFSDGAASTPSVTFSSDPTIGLYWTSGALNFTVSSKLTAAMSAYTLNVGSLTSGHAPSIVIETSGAGGVGNPYLWLKTSEVAASLGTCDSSNEGKLQFQKNISSTKSTLVVCAKDAGNAYAWRTLY